MLIDAELDVVGRFDTDELVRGVNFLVVSRVESVSGLAVDTFCARALSPASFVCLASRPATWTVVFVSVVVIVVLVSSPGLFSLSPLPLSSSARFFVVVVALVLVPGGSARRRCRSGSSAPV